MFFTAELDSLLCKKYPLIFAERHLSAEKSCMCRGFSCGDGWFNLIDTLCSQLQFETDYHGAPQIVAKQVKEKFGGLRFYVDRADKKQLEMIQMAQSRSFKICETCGNPGETVVDHSYHCTVCTEHTPEEALPLEAFLASKGVSYLAR